LDGARRGARTGGKFQRTSAILAFFAGRKLWELFFTILALTGLRSGEILGLRVADCDLNHGLIFIKQTACEGKIHDRPKTKVSRNSVQMASRAKELLGEYLVGHTHDFLFVNRNGRAFSRNKVVEKILRPALDALGIERKGRRIGLHAFRHGHGSMLVEHANAAVAQRQLRHAHASTTLGIYAHKIRVSCARFGQSFVPTSSSHEPILRRHCSDIDCARGLQLDNRLRTRKILTIVGAGALFVSVASKLTPHPAAASPRSQSGVALPMVASAQVPLYPPLARVANVEGVVHVKVTTDGHRVAATQVEDGNKLLAVAAEDNAKTWQFSLHEPTTFTVTYTYTILTEWKGNPNNPIVVLRFPTEVQVSTMRWVEHNSAESR
jgi:hypothetical protein